MSRSKKLIVLLASAAAAALTTPVLAGPTAGPSPTATPTATSTATPTPGPEECPIFWPLVTVLTSGRSNSPSNNAKVVHAITGFIINPSSFSPEGNRINVCRGTTVTATVTDLTTSTSTASNFANSRGIVCNAVGCSVSNIQRKERYVSHSEDGTDTDRISIVPK